MRCFRAKASVAFINKLHNTGAMGDSPKLWWDSFFETQRTTDWEGFQGTSPLGGQLLHVHSIDVVEEDGTRALPVDQGGGVLCRWMSPLTPMT